MSDHIRTFVAIDLKEEIHDLIKQIQDDFKNLPCDIKWVNPADAHLTLKFLGNVRLDQIELITMCLHKIIKDVGSISSCVTRLGTFPSIDRPRILWIGFKDSQNKIKELVKLLESEFISLGFQKEVQSFQPHVTIGRVRSSRQLRRLSQKIEEYPPLPEINQRINQVILYKSTLTPQGPIYEPISQIAVI